MAKIVFAHTPDKIRICVPNQSVPPFYIVKNDNISGMTIDHLDKLFQHPALREQKIQYVLQPWQRCLVSIDQGEVDLIVAGYSMERAEHTVFPSSMGFTLENSAFSSAQICFVKGKYRRWTWNGEEITAQDDLILGLEPGFLIPESKKLPSFKRYVSIWDASRKYELVRLDRVDAVLSVCGIMDSKIVPDKARITDEFEVIYPPYIDSPVYLTYSQAFFQTYPALSKLIISTSNQLDGKSIYKPIR